MEIRTATSWSHLRIKITNVKAKQLLLLFTALLRPSHKLTLSQHAPVCGFILQALSRREAGGRVSKLRRYLSLSLAGGPWGSLLTPYSTSVKPEWGVGEDWKYYQLPLAQH